MFGWGFDNTNKKIYDLLDVEIPYRDKLNLGNNITFGVEIEFLNSLLSDVMLDFCCPQLNDFNVKVDMTVTSNRDNILLSRGGEATSSILKDEIMSYQKIKLACETLKEEDASVGDKTGGHIHFGYQSLGFDITSWVNFIKLWTVFENIIMKFSYGKDSEARFEANYYSKPIGNRFFNMCRSLEKEHDLCDLIIRLINISVYKKNSVDFGHIKIEDIINETNNNNSTIEFRCPNGTLDPIIWQNNINFFGHLINYAKSNNFDQELINRKLSNYDYFGKDNIEKTNYLYTEKAYILADLIFENELDKLYFLKQYFKAFGTKKELKRELRIHTMKQRW